MRGSDKTTGSLFSDVDPEERIPPRQPQRKSRAVVNDALRSLDAELGRLCGSEGRPAVTPDRPIRVRLLQILCPTRSGSQLMEQMDCNQLFHWSLGIGIDDAVRVPGMFPKNRNQTREPPGRTCSITSGCYANGSMRGTGSCRQAGSNGSRR